MSGGRHLRSSDGIDLKDKSMLKHSSNASAQQSLTMDDDEETVTQDGFEIFTHNLQDELFGGATSQFQCPSLKGNSDIESVAKSKKYLEQPASEPTNSEPNEYTEVYAWGQDDSGQLGIELRPELKLRGETVF